MELLRAKSMLYLLPLSVKQILVMADFLGLPRTGEKKQVLVGKVIDAFVGLSQAEKTGAECLKEWMLSIGAQQPAAAGEGDQQEAMNAAEPKKVVQKKIPGGPSGLGSPGGPSGLGLTSELNLAWERRFAEMSKAHQSDIQHMLARQIQQEARDQAKMDIPEVRVENGEDQKKIDNLIQEARGDCVLLQTDRGMSEERREATIRRVEGRRREIGILIVKDKEGPKVANLLRVGVADGGAMSYMTGLNIDKAKREIRRRKSRRDEGRSRRSARRARSSSSGSESSAGSSPPAKRRRGAHSKSERREQVKCFACHQPGHIAPHCPDVARRGAYMSSRFAPPAARFGGGYGAGGGGSYSAPYSGSASGGFSGRGGGYRP
jgi:hypothetical protein